MNEQKNKYIAIDAHTPKHQLKVRWKRENLWEKSDFWAPRFAIVCCGRELP